MNQTQSDADRVFAEHRPALIGAAYRILGSYADAEDVVQDCWLRWSDVDRTQVENPRAYLITMATRQAINLVRKQQRRRETYIGPWLPEPLPDLKVAGADAAVEQAESVSMAMLVILQTLSPAERAAFVMREVFGFGYDEIASSLDRTEPAVRKLVSRAKAAIRDRQPKNPVTESEHREVTEQALASMQHGDLDGFVRLLDPGVELISDGGGHKRAALRPITGADKVVRWLFAVLTRPEVAVLRTKLIMINGSLAVVAEDDRGADSVAFLEIDGGKIIRMYLLRNPEKLQRLPA